MPIVDAMKSGLRILFSQAKAPLSAGLVLLLFFVQTLAASEVLHLDIHNDAHSADHTCAVKTLSQGQLDAAAPAATLELPPVSYREVQTDIFPVAITRFFSVDSSRGPPSLA
jgi:hypothetical protein